MKIKNKSLTVKTSKQHLLTIQNKCATAITKGKKIYLSDDEIAALHLHLVTL